MNKCSKQETITAQNSSINQGKHENFHFMALEATTENGMKFNCYIKRLLRENGTYAIDFILPERQTIDFFTLGYKTDFSFDFLETFCSTLYSNTMEHTYSTDRDLIRIRMNDDLFYDTYIEYGIAIGARDKNGKMINDAHS